jgi:hypothetical protein
MKRGKDHCPWSPEVAGSRGRAVGGPRPSWGSGLIALPGGRYVARTLRVTPFPAPSGAVPTEAKSGEKSHSLNVRVKGASTGFGGF